MSDYYPGKVRKTMKPETISRLTYKPRQRLEPKMQTGKHDGAREPMETNTVIELIDVIDALNRLPSKEWNMLYDYCWWGENPETIIIKYACYDQVKMHKKLETIYRKVARWADGRYKGNKKPLQWRNITLSKLIDNIF